MSLSVDPKAALLSRSLRIVLFGFQILSAGVAFVIGSTQLVAALANAPKHLPLQDVAQVCQLTLQHLH